MTGINNPEIYLKNKYYIKYRKQRQKIVDKYKDDICLNHTKSGPRPYLNYNDKERKLYHKYLKEIGDLLFKPNGNYQKFVWETKSPSDKLIAERRIR